MKKSYIFLLFSLFTLVFTGVKAQRATATSRDATQLRLTANLTSITVSVKSGTAGQLGVIYTLTGTYGDPSGTFARSSVSAGMHFLDAACKMYRIETVATSGITNLILDVTPLGTTTTQMSTPSAQPGLLFDPTPNLILPQWVFNIPPKIQSCLLSHMANILDLKLGSISPSILIKTTSYDLSNYDDTVLFDIASASTLTLPSASANTAKIFKIGKIDESTSVLTFSPAIRLTATTSISTLNYPRTFIVQSDGTDWRVINQN